MKLNNLKIYVLGFLLVTGQSFSAWSEAESQSTISYDPLAKIRVEAAGALEENKYLEEAYNGLSQNYDALQKEIALKEQALQDLKERSKKTRDLSQSKSQKIKSFYEGMGSTQTDIMVQQARYLELKKQFLSLEEETRALKLTIAEADLEKRKLQLDVEGKSLNCEEQQKQMIKEVDDFSKKIDDIERQETLYLAAILEVKSGQEKLSVLKKNLNAINEERDLLNTELAFYQKENDHLFKKKQYVEKSQKIEVEDKERNLDFIKGKVKNLNSEYDRLDKSLQEKLAEQSKKKELVQEILKLDKQNQLLRDRIEAARQRSTEKKLDVFAVSN